MEAKQIAYNLEYLKLISKNYPELLNYANLNLNTKRPVNTLSPPTESCNCCTNAQSTTPNNECSSNTGRACNSSSKDAPSRKDWPSFVPYKKRIFSFIDEQSSSSTLTNISESVCDVNTKGSDTEKVKTVSCKEKLPKKEVLPNQPKKSNFFK